MQESSQRQSFVRDDGAEGSWRHTIKPTNRNIIRGREVNKVEQETEVLYLYRKTKAVNDEVT